MPEIFPTIVGFRGHIGKVHGKKDGDETQKKLKRGRMRKAKRGRDLKIRNGV